MVHFPPESVVQFPQNIQKGVTMIEYALIASLVALAAIGAITLVGGSLTKIFTEIANKILGQ